MTLISNWIPFESPAGGPNFYPWAENTKYDINIDNNADAKPDITYRWTFTSHYKSKDTFLYNTGPVNDLTDATLNFTQTYNLERIVGGKSETVLKDAPVAPSNVGAASMPDYAKLRTRRSHRLPTARRSRTRARPTIRSSSTCACSTSCTGRTSRRPGPTRSTVTTST